MAWQHVLVVVVAKVTSKRNDDADRIKLRKTNSMDLPIAVKEELGNMFSL